MSNAVNAHTGNDACRYPFPMRCERPASNTCLDVAKAMKSGIEDFIDQQSAELGRIVPAWRVSRTGFLRGRRERHRLWLTSL